MFDGIGCLEGTYRIKIDPTVSPVVHPPRKIPFTQREKVKEELDRMEKLGVIRKAEEPIIIIIIIHLYSVFSQWSKNASQKGNYNYKLPMTIKNKI